MIELSTAIVISIGTIIFSCGVSWGVMKVTTVFMQKEINFHARKLEDMDTNGSMKTREMIKELADLKDALHDMKPDRIITKMETMEKNIEDMRRDITEMSRQTASLESTVSMYMQRQGL